MEQLLLWSSRAVHYLKLKRLAIGLTADEDELLTGLTNAISEVQDNREKTARHC